METLIIIIAIMSFVMILFVIYNIADTYQEVGILRRKVSKYEHRETGITQRENELEKEIETKRKAIILEEQHLDGCRRELILEEQRLENQRKALERRKEKVNQELDSKRKNIECERHAFNLELDKNTRLFEQEIEELKNITKSNLTAIPYMAGIIADFDTRDLEILAKQLDWGFNQERMKKVKSIRDLRKETTEMLAQYKEAQYQLQYAIKMFPALADFLEAEYNQLPTANFTDLSTENHDAVRNYLSKDEYLRLSPTARNQLALDRYRESRQKTNWQIGRDYELYVGYKYSQKGYSIDYYGANHGLEDLGRDIIAKKGHEILIIQCKYWSSKKQIHENHINQLFGTMICYCLEHNLPKDHVKGVLITNISLSDTAKRFAKYLEIMVVENYPISNYPCIKCNINRSKDGEITKIYHLPFDQQYDSCKIDSPGEFFAMTVAEAEAAGFRRAFRWHNT